MPKTKKRRGRRRGRGRLNIILIVLGALCAILAVVLIATHSGGSKDPTVALTATPPPTEQAVQMRQPVQPVTQPPTAEPTAEPVGAVRTITITATGDCTLGGDTNGTGLEQRFATAYEKCGSGYFLENVRALFSQDDFTIVNLEGPLTDATEKRANRQFNMRGSPEYAKILSAGGVEVASVANNHALDFQQEGLYDTRDAVEAEGVGVCGYSQVYYAEKNGVKVGFMGLTEWDYSADEAAQMVADARAQCDLLIVYVHWGEEKAHRFSSAQRTFGERLIDAGADLVVGNHSHVYGEIYQYKGKYIIYSLGNFCFGGNRNPEDKRCVIFRQRFDIAPDGTVRDAGIDIIPASVSGQPNSNDYQPRVMEADEGRALLAEIAKISNLTPDQTVWMESSYEVSNNIISEN